MRHSLPPFASRFHSPNKRLYHPRLLAKQEGRGYVDFREVTHGPSCRFISRLLPAATQFSYQPLMPEAQFPRTLLLRLSKKWLGGSLEGEFRALLWSRNSDLPCFIDSQIPNSSPIRTF